MKKLLKKSLVFIILAVFVFQISSCTKDCPIDITPTPKTIEVLLTQKTWKADEIRVQQSNNITQYYKRGGASNTTNYDSDSLKFNTNNTGIYYFSGSQYTTTWNFINAEKSKMTIVINYPSPITINWEYVNVAEAYLKYTQYVTAGGISYLASGTRTPN